MQKLAETRIPVTYGRRPYTFGLKRRHCGNVQVRISITSLPGGLRTDRMYVIKCLIAFFRREDMHQPRHDAIQRTIKVSSFLRYTFNKITARPTFCIGTSTQRGSSDYLSPPSIRSFFNDTSTGSISWPLSPHLRNGCSAIMTHRWLLENKQMTHRL
jgi:hypothetical protein